MENEEKEVEEFRKKILQYIDFVLLENGEVRTDDSYTGRFNQGAMFALHMIRKYIEEA